MLRQNDNTPRHGVSCQKTRDAGSASGENGKFS